MLKHDKDEFPSQNNLQKKVAEKSNKKLNSDLQDNSNNTLKTELSSEVQLKEFKDIDNLTSNQAKTLLDNQKEKRRKKRGKHKEREEEIIKVLNKKYKNCKDRKSKVKLSEELGITIRQMYNYAHQEGLTRKTEDLSDKEFKKVVAGDTKILTMKQKQRLEDQRIALSIREDPETLFLKEEDKKFIIDNFESKTITEIAIETEHSESAVLYYARHLERQKVNSDGEVLDEYAPLRRPARGFSIEKVCSWLNLTREELIGLSHEMNVIIKELPNNRNEKVKEWVESRTLYPFINKYKELLLDKGADKFFIKEIIETEELLVTEKTKVEDCYYLDHGHVCQNPWAGPCYELYCDGNDPRCMVKELRF